MLLLAVPAEGATPLVRHAVPGAGFSIGVPAGWRSVDYRQVATGTVLDQLARENPSLAPLISALRSPSSGVKLFAFDPRLTAGFATNMNVVVEVVPAGTTAEQYADEALTQLRAFANVVRPIRRTRVHLPAGAAVRLRYGIRFAVGGKSVVTATTQYVLVKGYRAYIVTYTTLPSLDASRSALFAASARSIRLR